MARQKQDLLQGTLDMLILQTLALEPMHGWGISQRIQQISRDVLRVNQGSLYPALHRLEQQGWIDAEWDASENNRQAKYYRLTRTGKQQLAEERENWARMTDAVARILQGSMNTRTATPSMPAWLMRVRTLFRRARMERELDAELPFHLDMQAAEYVARGMSPDAARRAARQTLRRRRGHQGRRPRHLADAAGRDARRRTSATALRSLRKQRGYALAVIVTMALGIGANTRHLQRRQRRRPAAAALRARRRPAPPAARRAPASTTPASRSPTSTTSKPLSAALDAVVEYHNMYFILLGGDEPERVATGVVSWDYFETLGVTPAARPDVPRRRRRGTTRRRR